MSIVQRYVVIGFLVAFISFIAVGIILFYSFPFIEWSTFWNVKIVDLPLIIFCVIIILFIGVLAGLLSGLYEKKQWEYIYEQIVNVEHGRNINPITTVPELDSAQQALQMLQEKMKEQTKLAQKLANEKAVDVETALRSKYNVFCII